MIAQVETTGQAGQGLPLDQARAQARQLAFAGLREALEQRFAGDEVENGVTEKLQALIVAPGVTAMGQCQEHLVLVLEGVTELSLQTGKGSTHAATRSLFNALFKSTS
ncbi:hypothetical protein D3C75_820160 [compost metagenome]